MAFSMKRSTKMAQQQKIDNEMMKQKSVDIKSNPDKKAVKQQGMRIQMSTKPRHDTR